MDLRIEPARPDEASVLAAMVVGLYRDDPGPVAMTAERAEAQAQLLVSGQAHATAFFLRTEARVVGYAILVPFWSNEFGGRVLVIDELFVVPEARGGGLGKAFFGWLDGHARAQGFGRLFLEVNDQNPRARQLYERAGFTAHTRVSLSREVG